MRRLLHKDLKREDSDTTDWLVHTTFILVRVFDHEHLPLRGIDSEDGSTADPIQDIGMMEPVVSLPNWKSSQLQQIWYRLLD